MKQLLIVAVAALLSLSVSVRAEGPDDKYIEIYKLIQEGDRLAAAGQASIARERYITAQEELKRLKASHPNWNQQLIDYRLRTLDTKLAAPPKATPATPGPTPEIKPAPSDQAPRRIEPPPVTRPTPQPEADDRDHQIKALQEQMSRLQNDRGILESKLREALSAQPAAVDPRELARAEDRIKALEKDKEVLRVSVEVAEARAARQHEAGAVELKKALEDARQNLTQQNEIIAGLRQEKELLQHRLQTVTRADEETLNTLRTENQTLKQQLADKAAGAEAARGGEQVEKELASTKAALQTSRDTMNSLQVRVRTLQEERDRLEKTRTDLERRLAAASSAATAGPATESAKAKQLQKERDDLQKKLSDANRQLADSRGKSKTPPARTGQAEDATALRARLEVLEARKVPYTPEELAMFKKPQEPAAVTSAPTPQTPPRELPGGAAPLLAEAQRAFSARRFDEAEKKYAEVLQFDDKNVATLQRLAAAQLEQDRPQDAETNLKRALDENPKDPRSLLLMGIAKFDQDKFDDAFENLSRSAQADPQNAETQNYLGITLSQKGQRAAAETALRKAIQLSPNYASAHYNLAVVYATQHPPFTELARWHYQKALAYGHPQNPEVEKMLERKQAASQK